MTVHKEIGIWKSGSGKGKKSPKGRQAENIELKEISNLLGTHPRRKDLLIEYLHLIQDKFGCIGFRHISALAEELKLSQTEVYEVATFYAHFDVVREGEVPPAPTTIRVCDSLSCELKGAQSLLSALKNHVDPSEIRVIRAPCMGRCDTAPVLEIGHNHIDHADLKRLNQPSKGKIFFQKFLLMKVLKLINYLEVTLRWINTRQEPRHQKKLKQKFLYLDCEVSGEQAFHQVKNGPLYEILLEQSF